MQGKIAFEEHFAIEETLGDTWPFAGDSGKWSDFTREILDLGETRLGYMDDAGIELAVLSLHAPGIQGIVDPVVENQPPLYQSLAPVSCLSSIDHPGLPPSFAA